ncbi:MAG: hypothetical protein F6K54_01555 [Okeania sp. SIO3B5]|uniref:hypothetical protein n=1 Tax=Okeania sp. SIO3B5 TaxID=2607811 RepID=UPI0013FF55F5|nr:hypothetical protein [Okeania sp. SIO3B5]NEO51888.1 hypothetical protein [Okeania sp. SIO3B5]
MRIIRNWGFLPKGKVEHLGPLMLWDERVKLILNRCNGYCSELSIYENFQMNPTIYAVHSAVYQRKKLEIISLTEFHPRTRDCKSVILNLSHSKDRPPPERIQHKISKIISDYVGSELSNTLEELASLSTGGRKKLPYSSSFTTIEMLIAAKQRGSDNYGND